MNSTNKLKCTFCGKPDGKVLCLIAAPNQVMICDKCVEIARDIVGTYRSKGNKVCELLFSAQDEQK